MNYSYKVPTMRDVFGDVDRFFVGFDDTFRRLNSFTKDYAKTITSNYPPFNVKKLNENRYVLELAVAGFGKGDLNIEMKDGVLTIHGRSNYDSDNETAQYLVKGVAERGFERSFTLSDTVEVKNAELLNGMLKIYLDNVVPVTKAVQIAITDGVEAFSKSLDKLTENSEKKEAA